MLVSERDCQERQICQAEFFKLNYLFLLLLIRLPDVDVKKWNKQVSWITGGGKEYESCIYRQGLVQRGISTAGINVCILK